MRGFEPIDVTTCVGTELRKSPYHRGAESGALDAQTPPIDADLQTIIDVWPVLPHAIKAGILAIVEAARPPDA